MGYFMSWLILMNISPVVLHIDEVVHMWVGAASIQLCDVLLGAVMSEWDRQPAGGAKGELRSFIEGHLGWENLHADTHPHERKFNVWMFYDTRRGPRQSTTRPVLLTYPLPERR